MSHKAQPVRDNIALYLKSRVITIAGGSACFIVLYRSSEGIRAIGMAESELFFTADPPIQWCQTSSDGVRAAIRSGC
jgi:hypothetical protein